MVTCGGFCPAMTISVSASITRGGLSRTGRLGICLKARQTSRLVAFANSERLTNAEDRSFNPVMQRHRAIFPVEK